MPRIVWMQCVIGKILWLLALVFFEVFGDICGRSSCQKPLHSVVTILKFYIMNPNPRLPDFVGYRFKLYHIATLYYKHTNTQNKLNTEVFDASASLQNFTQWDHLSVDGWRHRSIIFDDDGSVARQLPTSRLCCVFRSLSREAETLDLYQVMRLSFSYRTFPQIPRQQHRNLTKLRNRTGTVVVF